MSIDTQKRSQHSKSTPQALRVLIHAPGGSEGEDAAGLLRKHSIAAYPCNSLSSLCEEIEAGAGAVLLSDEALADPALSELAHTLDTQPGWSEIPVLLLARDNRGSASLVTLATLEALRNVTLLERPLRPAIVLSAIQAALRGRERQYQLRDVLVELHRARGESERANMLKDEFLATLSHELRTPVNAILGWLSMLRSGQVVADQVPRVLQMLDRNAQAQAQVISDLLDVSHIVTGRLQLTITPTSLARVLSGAVETIRPAAEMKGVELHCDVNEETATVHADAERLRQVFWNLLSNAVRFTPRGGRVGVTTGRSKSFFWVVVSDTGVGMTPEFLPFAFDRFRQGDQSFSRPQGGLGLGLAIVRHVVQMHGGDVTASSEGPNCGSTFRVALPVPGVATGAAIHADATAGGRATPATTTTQLIDVAVERQHADFTGRVILIVEDDSATRELLQMMFDRCGATVRSAESAREALVQFEEEIPSLVLADIGMPVEDGLSLVRRIRRRTPERGGTVPVVALSAHTRAEDRRAALAAGFDEFVTKPAAPATLIDAVQRTLPR